MHKRSTTCRRYGYEDRGQMLSRLANEMYPFIPHLQSRKLATWIISGDNITTVKAVAKQVGIPKSNVIGGVLPQEKVDVR
jgi:cation transport ATPase